jgi:hypothetical protein
MGMLGSNGNDNNAEAAVAKLRDIQFVSKYIKTDPKTLVGGTSRPRLLVIAT